MQSTLLELWRKLNLAKSAQMRVLRVVNDEFLVGVTGVIFNKNDEVLIVKHSYRRVPWSLPGGFLKGKEHPKKGLEREILEETNFKVRVDRLIKTQHDTDTAKIDLCYAGKYKKGVFKKSAEVIDYGFFSRENLPPLIKDQYKQIDLAFERYGKLHRKPLFGTLSSLWSRIRRNKSK